MKDNNLLYLDDVPSLEGAAKQINSLKELHHLKMVYLATDAPIHGGYCRWFYLLANTNVFKVLATCMQRPHQRTEHAQCHLPMLQDLGNSCKQCLMVIVMR